MIVEPSKECKNERSQEVQVLRKGVHSKEWIAEVLLRGVPDESERGRADEADRFQSQADIDKPEVRVMVNPGGLNEKFANENLTPPSSSGRRTRKSPIKWLRAMLT